MTPAKIEKLRSDLKEKFALLSAETRGKWASAAAGADWCLSQGDPDGARACVASINIPHALVFAPRRATLDAFLELIDNAIMLSTPPSFPPFTTLA